MCLHSSTHLHVAWCDVVANCRATWQGVNVAVKLLQLPPGARTQALTSTLSSSIPGRGKMGGASPAADRLGGLLQREHMAVQVRIGKEHCFCASTCIAAVSGIVSNWLNQSSSPLSFFSITPLDWVNRSCCQPSCDVFVIDLGRRLLLAAP
jgi:hypothetical protein